MGMGTRRGLNQGKEGFMSTSSNMGVVLLLLFAVTFPLQAMAGRLPSAASPATLVLSTPPQVQVPAATDTRREEVEAAWSMTLEDDAKLQARSFPSSQRKMNRQLGSVSYDDSKQVRNDDDVDVHGHRLQVGSSAPTCQGKCGQCNPCNPIHMTIGSPHGTLTQQEYYPEVWRCKCGGVYFMP